MVHSVPISKEESKRLSFRIVILSGISITSGAILLPLAIVWYIQPPPIGYLASILALIILIVLQLGVQRLRYYLEVKWRSVDASYASYLRNKLPIVVFNDFLILLMIAVLFFIPLIKNTPLILLLCTDGLIIFVLFVVVYSLKTKPRLPKRFRVMKSNEHPLVWELLDKSKIKIRSIGFLDYPGLKIFNAFQWGTGSNSIIALTDELENVLEEEELAAIAAHELGHVHYGHFKKLLIASMVSPSLLLNLCFLYLILDFGSTLTDTQQILSLLGLFFIALGPPILLIPWLTRRWESKADLYAASLVGIDSITSALHKLVEYNIVYANIPKRLEFLISHPILKTRIDLISGMDDS
ncbi:MAG: M48 family metalloprotease [Candidatus Thorarchaeota archaeon]